LPSCRRAYTSLSAVRAGFLRNSGGFTTAIVWMAWIRHTPEFAVPVVESLPLWAGL
jgi:hypothetical protein